MAQVELVGTDGPDLLDGSGYGTTVVIRGLGGDNTLIGGSGNDRISGYNGNNLMYGGDGSDRFYVAPNPLEFNTIFGGAGYDYVSVNLTAAQYASPAIRAAVSQLDYFMAKQASDPTKVFESAALHLTMSGVEEAQVRIEATLNPAHAVVPGAFAVVFENTSVSHEGTDYTLASRWVVDGANFVSGATFATVARDWQIIGSADFNGDLKADLLWENQATGEVSVWTMDGDTFLLGNTVLAPPADSGWKVFGTGDFNGDLRADILIAQTVTDPATGLPYADLSILTLSADGQTVIGNDAVAKAASGWSVIGLGDFDGDGKSDLLWRDTLGKVAIWEMDGSTFVRGDTLSNVNADWSVAGIGDFDGDGRSDILWRNTDGAVSIWEMNGLLVKADATIWNPGSEWLVAGVADHDGDGRSDILWRHAPVAGSGETELQVWTMDGLAVTKVGTLAYVPNDWHTV